MAFFSRLRSLRVQIVRVDASEPWRSTPNTASCPLAIMALILAGLLAWVGIVLDLPPMWTLVPATTLVLGLVTPYTLRLILSFSRTGKD